MRFLASVASFLTAGGGTAFGGILRRRVFHLGHGLRGDNVAASLTKAADTGKTYKKCAALYNNIGLFTLPIVYKNSRESTFPATTSGRKRQFVDAIGDEVSLATPRRTHRPTRPRVRIPPPSAVDSDSTFADRA